MVNSLEVVYKKQNLKHDISKQKQRGGMNVPSIKRKTPNNDFANFVVS